MQCVRVSVCPFKFQFKVLTLDANTELLNFKIQLYHLQEHSLTIVSNKTELHVLPDYKSD